MTAPDKRPSFLRYLFVGVFFGIVATRSQIISWYRIQEMFHFDSFYMYGILGSAVMVSAAFVLVIRRLSMRGLHGDQIEIPPKEMGSGTRYAVGGTLFGLGWGLVGSCPGPIFALIGNGVFTIFVVLASAMAGTWAYALLRPRLPH